MKKQLLNTILRYKIKKVEFSIITNLESGESCIFEKNKPLEKNFDKYPNKKKKIKDEIAAPKPK